MQLSLFAGAGCEETFVITCSYFLMTGASWEAKTGNLKILKTGQFLCNN